MPFCPVCRSAGKTEEEYTSHYVRSSRERDASVTCPVLLNRACYTCGEKGHTPKYCKKAKTDIGTRRSGKHIGIPVYSKHKGKKELVGTLEAPEEPVVKPGTGGEGKRVRLLIDEVEVNAPGAPMKEAPMTLALEKKALVKSMKPVNLANQFECLGADESDSDDDMCYTRSSGDEEDEYYTPKKSWVSVTTPGAPKRLPGPPRLIRQRATGSMVPKKLEFPAVGASVSGKKPKGVWVKDLKTTLVAKHGSISAWQSAPEKTYDDTLLERKQSMASELAALRKEKEAMAAELARMKSAQKTSYASMAAKPEVAVAAPAPVEKKEVAETSPAAMSAFMKKYEKMSWADMMDEEDGTLWGDMVDLSDSDEE